MQDCSTSSHPTPDSADAARISALEARVAELEAALAGEQQARQAAERAHQEQDDAFSLLDVIFATAPVGLGVLDADLRYIRVNQALADVDGLPISAYPSRTPGELLPELAPTLEPIFLEVLATGAAVRDVEIQGVTAAQPGKPRSWLANYYPVYRANETMVGIGVVVIEITSRKQAEQELRSSEANLQAILASTAQAYLLLDTDLRLMQWNNLAETNIVERSKKRLYVGAPFSEYMQPEAMPGRVAMLNRVLAGEHIRAEHDMSIRGEQHWVAVEYAPVRETDGSIRGICISSLDITERRRAEADLRASEARFRLLAEQAQDLIYRYRLRPDPGFEYVSPSATTITGYTPEDHYADPFLGFKLVYSDDRPLLERLLNDTGAANGPLTLRWERKDGAIIWMEQVNQLICDETGQPVAIEGIARNITERKQAEEELRAAAVQLQSLSRRLVEAHEHERRHIARELHDEVGQVLTGLKLTLTVAASGAPPLLATTLSEAMTAINELMGRVRALTLDLRPALLDDMGLLPALGWYLDRYTPRTGVRVELRHQGTNRRFPAEVETVAYRVIQEALTNIARHARVSSATVLILADDQRLLLRIDDSGQGFDSEAALAAHATGGLSGMQERVQLIGGVLTIESAPGGGTQISAALPLPAGEIDL